MKKTLGVFIIAFALSIGLTFLQLVPLTMISNSNIAESVSLNAIFNLFSASIGILVFFSIFYLLANNKKIPVTKSTIIALLLGVILGSAFLLLLNIFLYRPFLGLYLGMATDSSVSGVFRFFFPALTAFLFVELRAKKSSNNLTA
jgi:hypothetical protein